MSQVRLDGQESVFFLRQLEAIDQKVYETRYPQYKARSLLPTVDGVDPTTRVYTYRLFDQVGTARFLGNMSEDLPRADAFGTETSQLIHPIGSSYGYSIYDIKAAAKMGTPLESMKALGARRAVEEKIDAVLALGDTTAKLTGLLSIASGTTSYTPSTKQQSGGTQWGTLAAPTASALEIANDIMGICSKVVENTTGAFTRFRVVLPIDSYNLAAQARLGDGTDTTALTFALQNCPYLESVEPWFRCATAGSGSSKRMCAFPYDPEVVAALVPEEFTVHPAEQRNLEFVINCTATTGGVVARYPVAIAYGDAI